MTHRSFRALAALASLSLLAGCGHKKGSPDLVCTNPVGTAFDKDGDLLTDAQEAALGTDPNNADSDGDGFSDYVEINAGTDPNSAASKPSGAIASVKQIVSASDLIGGPGAQAVVGDWLLQNDKIRGIVQDVTRTQMQLGTFGGNLIDADVVRTTGPGNDTLGMLIPLGNLGNTSRPTKAIVINDGADGGAAILRTCGSSDVYQYLDLFATLKEFGVLTHFDTNTVAPWEFSNDFVLAPGSNTIEVVTTIGNRGKTTKVAVGDVIDSGGAAEIFNTNDTGFGSVGFAQLLAGTPPPTKYMGFLAPGSGWGWVGDADPNFAITISGVTVLQQQFGSVFDVVGGDPESPLPRTGMNDLPHGGRVSYHRGIVVTDGTDGIDEIARVYYARHMTAATAAKPHTGTLLDANAQPVAGARVTALTVPATVSDPPLPQNVAETDATGNYTLTLPPGEYYLAADAPSHRFPSGSGPAVLGSALVATHFSNPTAPVIPVVHVNFSASEAAPDFTFPLNSHVNLTVTETGTGKPMPSRLIVVGTDPSPNDSIFRDQKEGVSSAIALNALSKDGTFSFDIEDGSYEAYVTHGLEFSVSSSGVIGAVGGTQNLAMQVGRVIDTTGWISGDFHVHMINSPDSYVPLNDRVIDSAAEGLDVLITTDHDYITDLSGIVTTLGLGTAMTTVPGEEVTTWDMGHFNTWPRTADPTHPADGGAYKWANGPGGNKTAAELFTDIAAAEAPNLIVKQVNHPRSGGGASLGFILQQWSTAIGLDTATLKTTTDPAFLRIPPQAGATADDTKLFYGGFNAQEVQNGFDSDAIRWSDLNDLMSFLSHGMKVIGTGNSDTHKLFSGQLGYPRNYVKLADDVPANLQGQLGAFTQSILDGHTFFTQGPFFTDVTVHGATDGHAGDLIGPASAGAVTLDATLDWPTWMGVDTLHVYVNTPGTTAPSNFDGNPNKPAAFATIDLRVNGAHNTAAALVVGGNGLSHYHATVTGLPVTVATATDSWILVDVNNEQPGTRSLFPIVPVGTNDATGEKPFALYNAIFIDGNNNGAYDAPGITFQSHLTGPGRQVKMFDGPSIPKDGTPEIRAQFEQLIRGECNGEAHNGKHGLMDHAE